MYYEGKLKKVLKHDYLMFEVHRSLNYVDARVNAQNVFHVVKMMLILTGLVYFTTIIWDITIFQVSSVSRSKRLG